MNDEGNLYTRELKETVEALQEENLLLREELDDIYTRCSFELSEPPGDEVSALQDICNTIKAQLKALTDEESQNER